jgi:hypothetical protein
MTNKNRAELMMNAKKAPLPEELFRKNMKI